VENAVLKYMFFKSLNFNG